ncbi:MAG: hypothetical protein E6J86_00230 [Deltaproteobacteria bacterium]|nr:MAG: hypothetical protein E6J86_00230 [Deltaproteobacteria bacterium]
MRFKGADGRWRGAPAKAMTKPAARLEALEREKLPYIRVGGLIRFVPSQLRDWAFTKDRTRG